VSYTRGSDLSGSLQGAGGIGGLLARTDHSLSTIGDPSANAFYHADGSGNITRLINQSQATVAKYIYDTFGNVIGRSGSLADANLYSFSSKEFHAASGLVYYLYRFYDPNLQRWLNRDPMNDDGFNVGSRAHLKRLVVERMEGPNLYRFVRNSSLRMFDGFGLGAACGSGPTSILVPDKPGGFNFTSACAKHDKCYGTCGAAKSDCDEQFLEDMQSICENSYFGSVGCNELANIYYGAVHELGQDPYDKAQQCACSSGSSGSSGPVMGPPTFDMGPLFH
jgi:RHS repeat-associated protein